MEFITERLILRPWHNTDAENLYKYAKDPEVGPIAGWPVHTSVEDSLYIIQNVLSTDETYAVCLKDDNRAIGSISLKAPEQTHVKTSNKEIEIGYWIGVPFWGKGYIPEAVKILQKHAFEDLDCTAIWCGYYDGNVKSKRCQEKCGFKYHHTEKNKSCTLMGDIRTEHFAYITREQWLCRQIRNNLFGSQDKKYRDFQGKLIPTVNPENIIGVRTPELRKYAKSLAKNKYISEFLKNLPHFYFDENQLHAFIISEIKDYNRCIEEITNFLPYVDNWATCDQMSPKIFKKHRNELAKNIITWIHSDKTYTIRFGIGMLMEHFLDEDFDLAYPQEVAKIRSKEYYVNMMIAWYFATALAKQYDSVLPFIENKLLEKWTHNKTIQKSVESNRISTEQKEYLKSLKIKE